MVILGGGERFPKWKNIIPALDLHVIGKKKVEFSL